MASVNFAANSTAVSVRAGGTLTSGVNATDVGNVGGGEDDLMTFTLAASVLAVDLDRLEIDAAFTFAANANNKTVKFYFGSSSQYSTGALAINSGSMVIRVTVVRTGAATQDVFLTAGADNTLLTTALLGKYTTATETLSGAITIKFTGTGTSDNDVVQKNMVIKFFPTI